MPPKDEKGKIKIRFFEVEVEGGSETLLEGVRTAAAVASRGSPVRVIRALPSSPVTATQNTQSSEPELFDGVDNETDEEQTENDGSPPKPKKNRVYPTPEIIELDLTSGSPNLEEFCRSKNPTEDSLKYVVVAAWLKEHRSISPIGINHIYTCFRLLGWGVQKDMGQPFRSQKKQGRFKSGAERGTFEITHIGLDVVRKMGAGPA